MKVNGQVVIDLMDCIAAAMKSAGNNEDISWVIARRVLDAIERHPTLKVTRAGVRPKQSTIVQSGLKVTP